MDQSNSAPPPAAGPAPPAAARQGLLAPVWRQLRLTRKEVLSILRDRRTIITLVLMPVLLYPVLTIGFQQFGLANVQQGDLGYTVSFRNASEREAIYPYLLLGLNALANQEGPARQEPPPTDGPSAVQPPPPTHAPPPGLLGDPRANAWPIIVPDASLYPDLETATLAGKVQVGLMPADRASAQVGSPLHQGELGPLDFPTQPAGGRERNDPASLAQEMQKIREVIKDARLTLKDDPDRPVGQRWVIVYREDSPGSREAAAYLEKVLAAANVKLQSALLQQKTPTKPQPPAPLRVSLFAQNTQGGVRSETLRLLVPLVLILMTITGAVYPAIDLTAGERERGTLETLVAAPIPRFGLLSAKYVAVLSVAVLTAVANLGTMVAMVYLTGLNRTPEVGEMGLKTVTLVFGLMLLFAAFFSAVLLALTSFARSFKEAQAYLVPLMLASLVPGMLPLLVPELRLDGPVAVVPLLNIVLLARDLFSQSASPGEAVVVVVSTLLYSLAAIAVAARLFGAEAVLYSEQSGWADLFRRPREPRPAADASGAMLCVALLFPASFAVNSLIGQFTNPEFVGNMGPAQLFHVRMLLRAVATTLLFAAIPFAAARRGNVDAESGFRLRGAAPLAFVAAALLGLSLWPLDYELTLAVRALGLDTLLPQVREGIGRELATWRNPVVNPSGPLLPVMIFGVLAAVCEELAFRGYLQTALQARMGPLRAVAASAVIFGLFHLVLGNVLVLERFFASTLMGLILGWLCWRSGSVFPGMLLHAMHNGFIILLAFYEKGVQTHRPGPPPTPQTTPYAALEGNLPWTWVAAAVAVAALGLGLTWLLKRRDVAPSG